MLVSMYSLAVTIIAKRLIASETWEIELERPHNFLFKAGQYLWLIVPSLPYEDLKGNRRAFSIATSSSKTNTISLIFRNTHSGYKKSLLSLPIGSTVNIEGPFGSSFILDNAHNSEIVMIAGGTGIAPFLSILRTDKTNISNRKITVIFINSTPEKAFYIDELNQITQKNKYPFINLTGKFSEKNIPKSIDKQNTTFYVCGPQGMIDYVASVLLNNNVSRDVIYFESNYPSLSKNLTSLDITKFLSDPDNIGLKAIQQSNEHIIITDENGFVLYANEVAQKITGYSLEEMKGNTPRLWGGLMTPQFYKELWKKKQKGEPFLGPITNRRKNGEKYTAQAHISPIKNLAGEVIGYIATEDDITQRIQLEIEIQNEKAKTDALLTSIGDGAISINTEKRITKANLSACYMLKMKPDEIIGKKLSTIVKLVDNNGNHIPNDMRPLSVALKGQTTCSSTIKPMFWYIRKDKTKFPIAITATPVILEEQIIGAIEIFRDISREVEIDQMKSEFISLASHQLRSPLTAMKWFCEMLLNGDVGTLSSEQKEYTQNIYSSNERMISLVNSLLNITRIESGRIIIDPKPTDVHNLIHEIVTEVKIKSNIKKQKVIIQIQPDLPLINIDPKLIIEVYSNLCMNASKYTPEGGTIRIAVFQKEEDLVSQVSDNGYGILDKDRNRVFSKFFRGENIVRIDTDGTGLGLYLVKTIIGAAGGKIWFESEEGKGTTFWFSIPMKGMIKKEGNVCLSH